MYGLCRNARVTPIKCPFGSISFSHTQREGRAKIQRQMRTNKVFLAVSARDPVSVGKRKPICMEEEKVSTATSVTFAPYSILI